MPKVVLTRPLAQAPLPVEPPAAIPPAASPPMDMELPGAPSNWNINAALGRNRWRRAQRNVARGVAVSLVLIITFGGLMFSQGYLKLHRVFRGGSATAAALQPNVAPQLLKGEGSGRINILLLGRGGGNHDGPDLTDTMMVASIDPVNHTTTLLSLPRDLWVSVPGQSDMKINAAWETGEFKYLGKVAPGSTDPKAIQAGFDLVDQTVSSVLDINIDYNVIVDFQAFQQAVDNVGGVNINVPTPLVDPTMAWENGGNATLANAGPQQFNGNQALLYVRSRETTSDFARAARQRAVLVALMSKVDTLGTLSNPLKISDLLNTFGNNVATDLSLSNADRLYNIMKNVDEANVTSISLDDAPTSYVTTGTIDGQSVVLPDAGLFQYGDIQTFVRGQLKDPYIIKENAKVLVLNGTNVPGLATTAAADLKTYGYNVIGAADTPTPDWTQTTLVDLSGSKDKYTENYLEQRYGVTAIDHLSDTSIATNGADFVIIIGNDEAPATQN